MKMSGSISEEDLLVFTTYDKWSGSASSIINQRVAKLSQSESLFKFCEFTPSLTFSDLALREIHLKNCKDKAQNWEVIQGKARFPRMIHTRSILKNELEILKINMSMQDKTIDLKESQMPKGLKDKERRGRKFSRLVHNIRLWQKFTSAKVKDLLTEIDGSETAKTDKVIWKFLKRGPSFRREAINARKLILQVQTLHFSVRILSDSRFQNTQPINVTCPNCKFFITTRVKKVSSIKTKLTSIVLAIFRLCIMPHVFYAFKDTVHLCPLCKIYLGFCPAFGIRSRKKSTRKLENLQKDLLETSKKMVSASSTSAKNLFVESKLRLSDRVQVNVNNIAAVARQIQRGSKANENLMTAAKNFALQEPAIENSETNLKKLQLLTTHLNNQLDSLYNSSSKIETVLEQVCSMQR